MEGRDNPADNASRGLYPRKETSSCRWFTGPAFLWQREELWPSYSAVTCVGDDDPEIKRECKSQCSTTCEWCAWECWKTSLKLV